MMTITQAILPPELVHDAPEGFEATAISYDLRDDIATLTLNGPKRLNALLHTTIFELVQAMDRALAEKARVLILTGAGKAFSSGGDLVGRPDIDDVGMPLEKLWNPAIEKLLSLPIPVITAVNGPAAGAGCSLALASDFVILERSAYFKLAFLQIGLIPDAGATWLITKLVGRQRATEIILLGDRVTAEKADAWGMVYKVVDDGTALEEAKKLAGRLATGPTKAYAIVRNVIRTTLDGTLSESLHAERVGQTEAGASNDFEEGVASFREKRPARFTGT